MYRLIIRQVLCLLKALHGILISSLLSGLRIPKRCPHFFFRIGKKSSIFPALVFFRSPLLLLRLSHSFFKCRRERCFELDWPGGIVFGIADGSDKIAVSLKPLFLSLRNRLPCFQRGGIAQIKFVQGSDFALGQIGFDHVLPDCRFDPLGVRGNRQRFDCRLLRTDGFYVFLSVSAFHICEEESGESFRVLSVHAEYLVKEIFCLIPIAVLQGLLASFKKRSDIRPTALLDNDRLLDLRFFFGHQFLHAANKVLHGAHLAHILRCKLGKLLGHVVGVHILEHRDQRLLLS